MLRIPRFVSVVLLLALGCAGTVPSIAQTAATHHHGFGGAEHWARVFDDPARDEWQKPHEVIQALALAPDSVVADIGSGTGYFSVRLAHFVPKGRVYGVDIEKDMVKYLAERAEHESLANITSLLGKPDDPGLPAPVDLVLMVDVYHHIDDRGRYFRKLRSYLKPGGRVAIIDFNARSQSGPPKSQRVAPGKVKAELGAAGFAFSKEFDFLPNQYFLVFRIGKS